MKLPFWSDSGRQISGCFAVGKSGWEEVDKDIYLARACGRWCFIDFSAFLEYFQADVEFAKRLTDDEAGRLNSNGPSYQQQPLFRGATIAIFSCCR